MKGFVGYVKGFIAAFGLLLAVLAAVIGWCVGLYTAVVTDAVKIKKIKKDEISVGIDEDDEEEE